MSVFQNIQHVSLQIDIACKIHLVERLQRNLSLTVILRAITGFMEVKVVLYTSAREGSLDILPRRVF